MVFDEEQLEALLEGVLVDVELHLHPGRRDGEVDGDRERETGGDKGAASVKQQGDTAGEVRVRCQALFHWSSQEAGNKWRAGRELKVEEGRAERWRGGEDHNDHF